MKKILSVFLSVLFLLTALPLGAVSVAAETASGTTGDCTWTLDGTHLTISGNGAMENYSSWSNKHPWPDTITSVTIEDGVTTIGDSAFDNCSSLESIIIPDSVITIGDSAFSDCTSLLSVVIPDSVTTIGSSAFWYCSSLEAVTIPNGVTNIGYRVFEKCSSLTSVTIPNGVTTIGESAFSNCTSLTSVTIPDSVTTIWDDAFRSCTSLVAMPIPNSVTTIGDWAFLNCTSLPSVIIPDSVITIGNEAFNYCASLMRITVAEENANYCDIDGVLFNKDATTLIQYPAGKTDTSYTIPDGVTTIEKYAFYGCGFLMSVTIPDSVTTIEERAFFDCTSLISVTIPDSVTAIESYTFYNCASLISVTIPDSVTTIGNSAFYDCASLTSVTIGDSVTTIGNEAFKWCGSLATVTIGGSVTTIGDYAFGYCFSLTSVTIPNSVTTIGVRAFSDCTSLMSVTIGSSVTTIGDRAFYSCISLTDITVAEKNANYCDVNGVLFNKDMTTLMQHPAKKTNTSYTIPNSVTTIGDWAFYACWDLTSVTIGNGVTIIGENAFDWCDSLTSVTISDSITTIGKSAFHWCDSLTDVYYGGSEEDRESIAIGFDNDPLLNATWHYNYVPLCNHEYRYPCDQYCLLCGELTNPDAAHTVEYAEAAPATCTENGNVEYWYCSDCRMVWLDADCIQNTNLMNVTIPAPGHTYDSACDTTCNVCGTVRDGAVELPTYDHITEPTILIPAVAGKPGETVSVQLYLKNNPGLVSAKVKVGYDADALELISYEEGALNPNGYSWGRITNNPLPERIAPRSYWLP